MNEQFYSPCDHVSTWLITHQPRIGSPPIKFERHELPAKTLVVWFSRPDYLIEIHAWDHAFCLDILSLNQSTGKTDYYVAGPCKNHAGLTQRLDEFLFWLESLNNMQAD